MEKENSTEEEPVGFPAPKNVTEVDQKEEQQKGNLVKAETENISNDLEIRSREDDEFSDNNTSSSNAVAHEPDIQKEEQQKGNLVNDTTLSCKATDIELRSQEEANLPNNISSSSPNQVSSSENLTNLTNNLTHEPDIQKEDQEKGNLVNDTKPSCKATDIEIRTHEEANSPNDSSSSSSNCVSSSENLTSDLTHEPDIQKEDKEKGYLVNDTTPSCKATDIEIRTHEESNSPNNSSSSSSNCVSSSGNLTNDLTHEPDTQKEEQQKGNLVNDTTPSCKATDIEIRTHEEANLPNNSSSSSLNQVSSSEKLTNDLAHEPDTQKEDQEKGNLVNDTTSNLGAEKDEISVNDTEQSPETTIGKNQCDEDIETTSEDVSHTTCSKKDSESSSFEEKGDMKTDPKDDNSCKEESLVLYGTREPKLEDISSVWPRKTSVLSKFVKLCTASNIFSNQSRKNDENNDSNKKDDNKNSNKGNTQEMSLTTQEKPRWSLLSLSLIKISNEKNQGSKDDQDEVLLESPELKPIKGRIVLYTKLWCKDCKEARKFLRKRKLRYSEINIDMYPSRKVELEEITGSSDVPKVFFNQVLIGGLNELRGLDESGQLEEKIDYVTSKGPSLKAPLPPLSGEDDVSSRGGVDELAVIVRKMKGSIEVKDRFYKFRRVTNCFLGSEVVDFLSEDQFLEREGAIEFARKLVKELFFRHVLDENTFEDGNHLYRFLDQDPIITQCQNIPRGIIHLKRQPLVELSRRLQFLLYAILDAYTSEDGKHIAYRTIHGSEEFARYLRIAEELQRVDLNKTTKEERLAFFINLYNLMTIHAILVWGHPEGTLNRRKMFNDFKYVIGGSAYSLSDIYNGVLRANQRPPYSLTKPFRISDKRFKVALPYPEPLIHFALVSGNRSAPALRCYSPKNIDKELMEAARDFLQSGAFELHSDSLTISVTKILNWYNVDFGKNEVEVLKHAANYLDVEKTQSLLELLDDTQLKVVYQPYDWRLNS